MIRELILLSSIGVLSYGYNSLIFPQIIEMISLNTYNLIVTYLLIMTQIDNFSLYFDLQKKREIANGNNDTDNKMNERYLKIISHQLSFICRKQEDIQKSISINNRKTEMVILTHRHSRSYNDLEIL